MNPLLWNGTSFDALTLATALLDQQKAHCRVYHDRDDLLLPTYTAAAISEVGKRANINLAQATFETVAGIEAFGWPARWGVGAAYLLPFNNVRELRVFDSDGNDLSSEWTVAQQAFGGNADAYMVSPTKAMLPTGGRIEIDVGVELAADLDPAVLLVVLRMGAAYYENRESDQPLTDTTFVASRFEAEIFSIWRPTA